MLGREVLVGEALVRGVLGRELVGEMVVAEALVSEMLGRIVGSLLEMTSLTSGHSNLCQMLPLSFWPPRSSQAQCQPGSQGPSGEDNPKARRSMATPSSPHPQNTNYNLSKQRNLARAPGKEEI